MWLLETEMVYIYSDLHHASGCTCNIYTYITVIYCYPQIHPHICITFLLDDARSDEYRFNIFPPLGIEVMLNLC